MSTSQYNRIYITHRLMRAWKVDLAAESKERVVAKEQPQSQLPEKNTHGVRTRLASEGQATPGPE